MLGLKEAGGKTRTRRTETGYKAGAVGQSGNGRRSPITIRTRALVNPARAGGKSHVLPWEISLPVVAKTTTAAATLREGRGEVSRGHSRHLDSMPKGRIS